MSESTGSGKSGSDPSLERIAVELKWLRILFSVITVCVVDVTVLLVFGQDAAVFGALAVVVLLLLYCFARVSIGLVELAGRAAVPPDTMNNTVG